MPSADTKELEASFRFIMRCTVCSEFRETFQQDFDGAFDRYYARSAFTDERRNAIRGLVEDAECRSSMDTIYNYLKERDIKPGRCGNRDPVRTPYVFLASAGLAAGVVLLSAITLFMILDGGQPSASLLRLAAGATLVLGGIQLFRSGRDKL